MYVKVPHSNRWMPFLCARREIIFGKAKNNNKQNCEKKHCSATTAAHLNAQYSLCKLHERQILATQHLLRLVFSSIFDFCLFCNCSWAIFTHNSMHQQSLTKKRPIEFRANIDSVFSVFNQKVFLFKIK